MIPIINDTRKKFTKQDNLALTSETNALQNALCPVIKSNTYRAFYWPFLVWNYYEYIKYSNTNHLQMQSEYFAKQFTKKNDYFFVLGNLLSNQTDQSQLVGKDNVRSFIVSDKASYEYNEKYYKSNYGGMRYYTGSCEDIGYIANEEGNNSFPKIDRQAEPLVYAFIEAIKNTEYYKNFLQADSVPKDVLIEWGNHVNLSMNCFSRCKSIIKKDLFDPTSNRKFKNKRSLIETAQLLKLLINDNSNPRSNEMRIMLFDDYFSKVNNKEIPEGLRNITISWETVVARQYFTFAIEMMWKALIMKLDNPVSIDTWIDETINSAHYKSFSPNDLTKDVLPRMTCSGKDIEKLISVNSIEDYFDIAITVLFTIYNRYSERELPDQYLLKYGDDVSICNLIICTNQFKDKSIKELMHFIAEKWILLRHIEVARSKMLYYGMDAYCFYIDNNRCFLKQNDIQPGFGYFKLFPLMQVMKDLDMINE